MMREFQGTIRLGRKAGNDIQRSGGAVGGKRCFGKIPMGSGGPETVSWKGRLFLGPFNHREKTELHAAPTVPKGDD
jgi:hypothetical protein